MGGYDIFVGSQISVSAFLPFCLSRQANSTTELTTAVKALHLLHRGTVAICIDLDYVFLGVTGVARRWKAQGWVGFSGPVSNKRLWDFLLFDLDSPNEIIG